MVVSWCAYYFQALSDQGKFAAPIARDPRIRDRMDTDLNQGRIAQALRIADRQCSLWVKSGRVEFARKYSSCTKTISDAPMIKFKNARATCLQTG